MKESSAAIAITWKDRDKKEVALIQRRPDYPHHLSGQWFFPGGVIEPNEAAVHAAIRECLEECQIQATDAAFVDAYSYIERWIDGEIEHEILISLSVFEAYYAAGAIGSSDETKDARWVPADELAQYITPETQASHLSPQVRALLHLET